MKWDDLFDGKEVPLDDGTGTMRLLFFVTVSDCPPERSEESWATREEARAAIERINKTGCGGQCLGSAYHYICPIDGPRRYKPWG